MSYNASAKVLKLDVKSELLRADADNCCSDCWGVAGCWQTVPQSLRFTMQQQDCTVLWD